MEACPPTAGYKLRKFARKNQKLLVTATAFVALLLMGVAGSAWQAVRATQAEAAALVQQQQANEHAVQAQEKEQEANQQRDEAQRQHDEVRALNEKLQQTLYAAHMNLAKNAWDAGDIERVRELLELHRPKAGETDLRHFEWNYLYRLCRAELLTFKGHPGGVSSVAFSPDGKRLASAGLTEPGKQSLMLKVWDARTGQELLTLQGDSNGVRNLIFSPDGKRVAGTGGWENPTVKVWDAQTGRELLGLKGGGQSLAFSPDGKRLASSSRDKTVKVWDARAAKNSCPSRALSGKWPSAPTANAWPVRITTR